MADSKKRKKRPSKAAKPEQVESTAEAPASVETAADAPPEPSQAVPPPSDLWEISSWKGLPNYECRFCAYATIDFDDAVDHYRSEHAPPSTEVRIIDTGLVNEDGTPIKRVEPAKEE